MQTYLDLSMLCVIGGAVVLLIIILVSFILNSRRCNALEDRLAKLSSELQAEKATRIKAQSELESVSRRLQAAERTVQYLTDNQQSVSERQAEVGEKINRFTSQLDNFNSRIEQQDKTIAEHTPENQPIMEARSMLRQGLSVDEVAERTGLPKNEVELLNTVHALNKAMAKTQDNKGAEAQDNQGAAAAVKVVTASAGAAASSAGAPPAAAVAAPSHPVASVKARDAYGIPGKKQTLRRTR